jgi:hypothetical protein
MKKAYYMNFEEKDINVLDKVGGLPTHLPKNFPQSKITGNPLGFLMQLYCDSEKLNLENALCLQIYQTIDINIGDDPMPVVIKIPKDAELNEEGKGTIHPDIEEYSIKWEEGEEPDVLPYNLEANSTELKMLRSKLKGAIPEEYLERNDITYLGWVAEYPIEFNFSGLLVLLKDNTNNIFCEIN